MIISLNNMNILYKYIYLSIYFTGAIAITELSDIKLYAKLK